MTSDGPGNPAARSSVLRFGRSNITTPYSWAVCGTASSPLLPTNRYGYTLLYGVCDSGGQLYSLDVISGAYVAVFDFKLTSNPSLRNPSGPLVFQPGTRKIYGTVTGGWNGYGGIFYINLASTTLTVSSFSFPNSGVLNGNPNGVTLDPSGLALYSASYNSLFKVTFATNTIAQLGQVTQTLYTIGVPQSLLLPVVASDGCLYGSCLNCYQSSAPQTTGYIYKYCSSSGFQPFYAPLSSNQMDAIIIGSSIYLSSSSSITIFNLTSNLIIATLSRPASSTGSVTLGSDGAFYSVASSGGKYGLGSAYRITLDNANELIMSFLGAGVYGYDPYGSFVPLADGTIIVVTKADLDNTGLFRFNSSRESSAPLVPTFDVGPTLEDAGFERKLILQPPVANIASMASALPACFSSTNRTACFWPVTMTDYSRQNFFYLFHFDPTALGGSVSSWFDFSSANITKPTGRVLAVASANKLLFYASTPFNSTIIPSLIVVSLTSGFTVSSVLAAVQFATQQPSGSLILASDGLAYGVLTQGGANNAGCIFSFNVTSSQYSLFFSFPLADPTVCAFPIQSLLEYSPGLLMGTCKQGGLYGIGGIFQINISFPFPAPGSPALLVSSFDRNGFFSTYYSVPAIASSNLVRGPDGSLYGTAVFIYYGYIMSGLLYRLNFPTLLVNASVVATMSSPPSGDLLSIGGRVIGCALSGTGSQAGYIYEISSSLLNPIPISSSQSASRSASFSQSTSQSLSLSQSASQSQSQSRSQSVSNSLSHSQSQSLSRSLSQSQSFSASLSASLSFSVSASASASVPASISQSPSASMSASTSISMSVSTSAGAQVSSGAVADTSVSNSFSVSRSMSNSWSISASINSASLSTSTSASACSGIANILSSVSSSSLSVSLNPSSSSIPNIFMGSTGIIAGSTGSARGLSSSPTPSFRTSLSGSVSSSYTGSAIFPSSSTALFQSDSLSSSSSISTGVGALNQTEQSNSASSAGVIAGGSVGGAFALLVIAGLGFWWFRRRSTQTTNRSANPLSSLEITPTLSSAEFDDSVRLQYERDLAGQRQHRSQKSIFLDTQLAEFV